MCVCGRAGLLLAALVATAGAFSVRVPQCTGRAARGLPGCARAVRDPQPSGLRPRSPRPATLVVRAVSLEGVRTQGRSAALRPAPAPDADALFAAAVALYEQVRDDDDDLARESAAPARTARLVEAARLLDRVFELDHAAAVAALYGEGESAAGRAGARLLTNLTCARPADAAHRGPAAPQLFDQELVALPLERGRACVCGGCSTACSRVVLPGLVAEKEADALVALADRQLPGLEEDLDAEFAVDETLHLKWTAAIGDLALHLLYVRLVERVRRVVAVEYGVSLHTLSVRSSFVSRIKAGKNPQKYSMLHVDECSTFTFHYSSVIYLSSKPASGGGGDFVFSDAPGPAVPVQVSLRATDKNMDGGGSPVMRDGEDTREKKKMQKYEDEELVERDKYGRVLTRVPPKKGQVLVMSSGWENAHFVEPLAPADPPRYAVPTFFSTVAPSAEYGEKTWLDGDEEARAVAIYELGLLPASLHAFLNFKQRWGELFPRL